MDLGGQDVFYPLMHFVLNKSALYLVILFFTNLGSPSAFQYTFLTHLGVFRYAGYVESNGNGFMSVLYPPLA